MVFPLLPTTFATSSVLMYSSGINVAVKLPADLLTNSPVSISFGYAFFQAFRPPFNTETLS